MSLNDEIGFNINDIYEIRKDWAELKKHSEECEKELAEFLGDKKNQKSGIRARRHLRFIRILNKKIAKNISKKKQDYDSDYS